MNSWASCDYLYIKHSEDGITDIFLIEKTDLLSSLKKLRNENSNVEKLRNTARIVHKKKSKKILSAVKYLTYYEEIKDGIIESCQCSRDDQRHIIDDIWKGLVTSLVEGDLAEENMNKLSASLLMLYRFKCLHQIPKYQPPMIHYHFMVLIDHGDDSKLGLTQARKLIETDIKNNIEGRWPGLAKGNGMMIHFGGISHSYGKLKDYINKPLRDVACVPH